MRFYFGGLASAAIVIAIVAGIWSAREMAREVAASGAPSAEARAVQRQLEGRDAASAGDAIAATERREKCLSDNLVPGLNTAASQVVSRACEELAYGGDDNTKWTCVLSMRTVLLNSPNPQTVLRTCGVR